jgi:hypothetical protein
VEITNIFLVIATNAIAILDINEIIIPGSVSRLFVAKTNIFQLGATSVTAILDIRKIIQLANAKRWSVV